MTTATGDNPPEEGGSTADLTIAVLDDSPSTERAFLDLTIASTDRGRSWMALLDGQPLLKRSTDTPLLSGARALQALGYPDETPIRMWHGPTVSLTSTVGLAAGVAVSEVGAPVFVRYSIPAEAECQRVAA
jgi:hypothetical protein